VALVDGELISVVVPVYGSEQFVVPCVESITGQTYRNLEIILIDDGSPDRSGQICDEFARHDDRICVIHQRNSGLVSARKAGLHRATGQYLSFVDGDDWIGPRYLEQMLALMLSTSADLAISGHVREFMGRFQPISPRIPAGIYGRQAIEDTILPQALFNGTFFQHGVSTYVWNKMFKREPAASIMRDIPSSIVMGEDASLTYPYLMSCEKVVIVDDGEYFYRQRHGSIVKSVESLDVELRRLSTLARFLAKKFQQAPATAQLDTQLRQYLYSLVLTRTGGVIFPPAGSDWFSPFFELSAGNRVIVCSSGTLGQHLVAALHRVGEVDVVGWIDEDDEESQQLGLPVTSLESAASMDFDLVLVASTDPEYSERVAAVLEGLGVDKSRVSAVRPDLDQLERILTDLGFDLSSFGVSLGSGDEEPQYD
jgi:hypothetical protein